MQKSKELSSTIQAPMPQIELVGYDEYERRSDLEPAWKPRKGKYPHELWSKARKSLIRRLSKHAKYNPLGYGEGDFTVGEDWFDEGAIHVVAMTPRAFDTAFVQECQRFLSSYKEYLITLGMTLTALRRERVKMVMSASHAYLSVYKRTKEEVCRTISEHQEYAGIREFLKC